MSPIISEIIYPEEEPAKQLVLIGKDACKETIRSLRRYNRAKQNIIKIPDDKQQSSKECNTKCSVRKGSVANLEGEAVKEGH